MEQMVRHLSWWFSGLDNMTPIHVLLSRINKIEKKKFLDKTTVSCRYHCYIFVATRWEIPSFLLVLLLNIRTQPVLTWILQMYTWKHQSFVRYLYSAVPAMGYFIVIKIDQIEVIRVIFYIFG